MCNSAMGTIKCILTSMIAGAALTAFCCCKLKNDKQMKKKATKAMYAVGDLLENVPHMFKQ